MGRNSNSSRTAFFVLLTVVLTLSFVLFTGGNRIEPVNHLSELEILQALEIASLKQRLIKEQAENRRLQKVFMQVYGATYERDTLRETTVIASSYNPLEEQCDKTPLIDSNNKLVMPGTLAIPRHWREELGLPLGTRVVLSGLGSFTITGHMNDRKPEGRVDIISFIPEWSKRFGKQELTMSWVTPKEQSR